MGLTSLIKWVAQLTGGNTTAAAWLIVAVLVVLLSVLSVGAVNLWPRSSRWAVANRIHRLATRNEAGLRRSTQRQLDDALAVLDVSARQCRLSGREDDAARLDHLIRQMEVVRDQVAHDYVRALPTRQRGGAS